MSRKAVIAVEEGDSANEVVGEGSPVAHVNNILSDVYRSHHQSLLRFLKFKLKSSSEANDIAQEAYVRVLRHGLPGDIQCARAYVFKTANNLAINRLLQRQRRHECAAADSAIVSLVSNEPTPEDNLQYEERLNAIAGAIDELPPKCRKAFILYKFRFLGYREVADRMNLTESMIRKYVLRAIRHCRRRFDEQPG